MKRAFGWMGVVVGLTCAACDSGSASSGVASAMPETQSGGSGKPAKASGSNKPTASSPAPSSSAVTEGPAKKDDGVALGKRYAEVGDKETETKTQIMTLKGNVKGKDGEKPFETTSTTTVEKTEECLEVKEKGCTKLRVTFAKAKKVSIQNGKTNDDPMATDGKTYIVTATDGGRDITHEDGSKLDAKELDALKSKYKHLTRGKALLDAMPASVKVGDSLDGVAKLLAEQSAEGEGSPKATVTLKVKEIREEGGKKLVVVDIHLLLEGESEKVGHMKTDALGTLTLDAATCRGVAGEFTGPMEMVLPKDLGTLKGTMTEKSSSTFSP